MKIYILLLSLCLFGCSQYAAINKNPDKYSHLPSWYVNPNQNNLQFLYGVGEGFTLQEASKSALNNIASKLIVTISSDSSSLSEENKYSFNEQYQQRIKEKVNNITFSDYKISNSSNINNKFYVEIAIDRYKFIKEQNTILDKYHKSMSNIYQSSKKQNILIQRNKLAEINNISKKAQIINQTLESLDSNQKYQINLSKYEFYISTRWVSLCGRCRSLRGICRLARQRYW